MMTYYRVTWVDDKGQAQALDVRTMRTAMNMAKTLQRAIATREVVVSSWRPSAFNELSIRYSK